MFCVVVGPDGSGKTTLLSHVEQLDPAPVVCAADPQRLYPVRGAPWHDWMSGRHPAEFFYDMRPVERATFLATTVAVEYEYYIAPALAAGATVLCDSYWYRMFAKVDMEDRDLGSVVYALGALLPRPDLVVHLDVDLHQAWERKNGVVTPYETYGGVATFENFARFQELLLHRVRDLTIDLPSCTVSAMQPVASVVKDVLTHVGCGHR